MLPHESLRDWNNHMTDTYVLVGNDPKNVLKVRAVFAKNGDEEEDEEAEEEQHYGIAELLFRGILYTSTGEKKGIDGREAICLKTELVVEGKDISMGFPSLGMCNWSNVVKYFCYSPNRQWKKSLSQRVVEGTSPVMAEMREAPGYRDFRATLCPESVYNIVNKVYTPVRLAYESVYKGDCLGRAIGENFALLLKADAKAPLIVYKNQAVGYMEDDTTIKIPHEVAYRADELIATTTARGKDIYYE